MNKRKHVASPFDDPAADVIQVTVGATVDGTGLLDFYMAGDQMRLPHPTNPDNLRLAAAIFRDFADGIDSFLLEGQH